MTKRQLAKFKLMDGLVKQAYRIEDDIMHSYIRETKSERLHFFGRK